MNFHGVYTAIITPFKSNGSFDEEGFCQLLDRQIQAKSQGIVVLGSTGETSTLTGEEKKRIIQVARTHIPSSMHLIVGTGTNATTTTISETQTAEKMGADAALIVSPYYNKPTQEGLFLHYQAIAESSKLPILLYNIAGRTGVNMQTSTVKRLAGLPTIIGTKEASGNLSQMMDVIEMREQERPDFKVFSGDDHFTLPLMSLGGNGIISVVSNLVPELIQELYMHCISQEWEMAKSLHYKLLPLFRETFLETNPIPIKAFMHFNDLPAGPCRLPLSSLSGENEKHLRHIHEMLKNSLLAVKAR